MKKTNTTNALGAIGIIWNDALKRETTMEKHATVQFRQSKHDNQMRYIYKYYLPQEL